MKKVIIALVAIVLAPVVLFFILTLLLYIPPVQQWAVDKVASYASEKTGKKIVVDHVLLSFPLDLKIEQFRMTQPNDSIKGKQDTVADVKLLTASVAFKPLLDKRVVVNGLELRNAVVNTFQLIPDTKICGNIGRLYAKSDNVDLTSSLAHINKAILSDAQIDIALGDTVPPDTTPSKNFWKINADKLDISNTAFTLHMPGDSMRVAANMKRANADKLSLLLHDSEYRVGSLNWQGGSFSLDYPYVKVASKGFDANHIALKDLNLGIDSFSFKQPKIAVRIRTANFTERCGMKILGMSSHFVMDSLTIGLPDLSLQTPYSRLAVNMLMDKNAFADYHPGKMNISIDGYVGKEDIMPFATTVPTRYFNILPPRAITVKGNVEGNLQRLSIRNLRLNIPTLFTLTASGKAVMPLRKDRRLNFSISGNTYNLSPIMKLLPSTTRKTIGIPNGIGWKGTIAMNGNHISTNMGVQTHGGKAHIKGWVDTPVPSYSLSLNAQRFPLQLFLPKMGLHPLTGTILLSGHGTDPLSSNTSIVAKANISSFSYEKYNLDNISLTASLKGGQVNAKINSRNSMAAGDVVLHGSMRSGWINMGVGGNIARADLFRLGIMGKRYIVSGKPNLKITGNMKNSFSVSGSIGSLALNEERKNGKVELINGSMDIDGSMKGNNISGRINGTFSNIDVYQLGIADQPLNLSFATNMLLSTNMKNVYKAQGSINNLIIKEGENIYQPDNMQVDLLSRTDTTHAIINGGDFSMNFDSQSGYEQILASLSKMSKEITRQLDNKQANLTTLRNYLPTGRLTLSSGKENVVSLMLQRMGLTFTSVNMDITSSAIDGLNGTMHADSLEYNGTRLDNVELALNSTPSNMEYNLSVLNDASNAYPFSAMLKGSCADSCLTAKATVLDAKGKTGLDMKLQAVSHNDGINLSILSPQSVIGYKTFSVNDSNYVFMGSDKRIHANVKLLAADGTGAQVYSDDEDSVSLQNLTLSIHKLELDKLFAVLPFTPNVQGVMEGDYHMVLTQENLSVSSDMQVQNLVYENCPMGNVGTQFIYIPQSDGTHYVDAIITQDDDEVGTLKGTYDPRGKGNLDAEFNMNQFPLDYINGFIPDQLFGLKGCGEGSATLKGPLDALDVNGEIYLDSASIFSEPYGVAMRFANDPVLIKNSKIEFENFEILANNNSPLDVSGWLDFSNMDRMKLDVRMRAENFELIDAKENERSEVYGKAFVNFFGRLMGPLNQLRMGGKLDVLGSTDMTYVMKDAILTTDNELNELVKFTSFSDTTADVVVRPDIAGLQMGLAVNIDEQAHVLCALNADKSNYIDVIGGGDLTMTYDPTNNLQLRGRYTLSEGQMKYSLPVIPLQTFQIQDGSYIEFTGNPYTPTLNITALESLKASVSNGTTQGRMVNFLCGVKLSKTFPKPGIEFIIQAPEDMEMQNELNTKSAEEQSKLAVSMLASGMYLDEGNKGNFAMNSALASFVQTEINNITGNALRSMGLDISANMESAADATGRLHTDYTFNFSKRLLNNRLRIIMGGRVSTGNEIPGDNGAYFDNFSMEYRLNKAETQYLKLYYEREAFDWLEGNISEFGAGFMWKRKLQHFKDIFRFKSQQPVMPVIKRDSILSTNEKKQ